MPHFPGVQGAERPAAFRVVSDDMAAMRSTDASTPREDRNDGASAPKLSLVDAGFDHLFTAVQEEWQDRALCAQTDPEAFFPEKGGSTREAKRICLGCEVRDECLEYALANDERFGIWGGLSERERRRLKRGIVS